jgi:hypothetical protein
VDVPIFETAKRWGIIMSYKTKKIDGGARRFGVIAVQKGFITQHQLLKALSAQVIDNLEGRPHRLIGEILYEQGAMTVAQIDEVLETLEELRRTAE